MEDHRCRLIWKKGEDVKKWILRVETYAAARGCNENKMAAEESEEFDFVIWHRPGASKRHADALSCTPTAHSLFCDGQLSLQEFQTCQQSGPVLGMQSV